MSEIKRDPRGRETSNIVKAMRELDFGEAVFIESPNRDYARSFLISASGSSTSKSRFRHLSFSERKSHLPNDPDIKGYFFTRVGEKPSPEEKKRLKDNMIVKKVFLLKD